MNKAVTISLEDVIEYYVMGSRLIGFITKKGKQEVKIFHNNGDRIEHINIDKDSEDKTGLIIDRKTKFSLSCIRTPNDETLMIKEIVLKDNTKRKLYVFMEMNGFRQKTEDSTIDVLLIARLLCMLANKTMVIAMYRYKKESDYQLGNTGCSVVIGRTYENMPKPEYPESTNALFIPEDYEGGLKELVKQLKSLLSIDRRISYLRVYEVYKEFKEGKLFNKNFILWGEAYNKFYQLDPDKTPLYQFELMALDDNTKVIVSYLASIYKIKLYKAKRKLVPLELTNFHPDAVAGGSSKFKADTFYKRIKRNYVNSMFRQNSATKPTYSYIMDVNGLLNQEDMKKYTDLLVYVINIVREENGMKMIVNLTAKHKEGMIGYFNSTSIAKILENNLMLKPLTIEFNPIM